MREFKESNESHEECYKCITEKEVKAAIDNRSRTLHKVDGFDGISAELVKDKSEIVAMERGNVSRGLESSSSSKSKYDLDNNQQFTVQRTFSERVSAVIWSRFARLKTAVGLNTAVCDSFSDREQLADFSIVSNSRL